MMDTISYKLGTALKVNYLQLGGRRGLLITHDANAAVCLPRSFRLSLVCIHFLHFKHLFERVIRGSVSYQRPLYGAFVCSGGQTRDLTVTNDSLVT